MSDARAGGNGARVTAVPGRGPGPVEIRDLGAWAPGLQPAMSDSLRSSSIA